MNPEKIQFNKEKFKEAVWFLASYCPPEELGNVKLHKMLYFADMMTFLEEGHPLTGVEYLKQQFGPTARYLTAAVSDLVNEGKLEVRVEDYHGYFKKNYLVTQPYAPRTLSEGEIAILSDVADFVRGKTAREISEISHNAAWEAAGMGEVLPYFTALKLVPTEITDQDRSWGLETAVQYAGKRPF